MNSQHSGERTQTRLVLASQSPRRVELLRLLNLQFDAIPSELDESTELRDPAAVVTQLAQAKAEEIANRLRSENSPAQRTLVIGADTIVVLGNDILGKPSSREHAYQMLMRMSGRCHRVFTGVSITEANSGQTKTDYEMSSVYFRSLDPSEVRWYCKTAEPMDKAGAYAVQGAASAFIDRIEGCYTNIVGLPLPLTVAMLREFGYTTMGMP